MRDNKEVLYIQFEEQDVDKLEHLFEEFPTEKANFISKTKFTDIIKEVERDVARVEKIFQYSWIGFFLFSVILFSNFIVVSINNSKKDIGILRALGASKRDVYKIFYLESFLIGITSFIISSALCYMSTVLSNNIIAESMGVSIRPIIFNFNIIIYGLGTVLIVSLLSSIIPLLKIAHMKPIEAIN
jgi:putative ABC transport system permease protein